MLVVKVWDSCVILPPAYCLCVFCFDYKMKWTFLDHERFISAVTIYGQQLFPVGFRFLLLLENAAKSDGAY